MSNIIPFDSGKLPAYLKSVDLGSLNDDLTAHASTGFPVMSIKGKTWAVVRDGERQALTKNIDGEEVPAPSVEVVLIKANKANSKVFYMKGFDEKAENQKPDCFSNDGLRPDAGAENPQSKNCAVCKHNQWGSKIGDNGTSKGKACSDSVRVAISPAGQINDPMLLRVPPASIKALGEYGMMLKKRGVAYNMVVTRVSFDMDAATPKLVFKPIGLLDDASYSEVKEVMNGDVVQAILGASFAETTEPVAAVEEAPEAPVIEKAKASAKAAAPSKPKEEAETAVAKVTTKAAKAAEAEVDIPELNLDDLNFDD